MPLYFDAEVSIMANLRTCAAGSKPSLVAIGSFTLVQWHDINVVRRGLGLHAIESREIVFLGRHFFNSRSSDGYSTADMFAQVAAALSEMSVVFANPKMTALESVIGRADGYGNIVHDRAVFECTQRKPRAELYSVIPKGDLEKPHTKKGPPKVGLSADDPG